MTNGFNDLDPNDPFAAVALAIANAGLGDSQESPK
jgi:hypothetical protein